MSKSYESLVTASKFTATKTSSSLIVGSIMLAYLASSPVMAEEQVNKLSEVTVREEIEEKNGYNNTKSSMGKLTGDLKDTPRTVTSVSQELMNDQAAHSLRDAMKNIPGISIGAGEGGNQGDNFFIRGFSARNDMYVDGFRDFGHYSRDPFNLESVEVLKGPSSVITGRGSTGGIINQQTKQAHLGDSNKNSIALGTNETTRFTTDVNTELSDTSAFRINLMAHRNEVAERDEIQTEKFGIAPSLAFGLGTDTRYKLDYVHFNSNEVPDYGTGAFNGKAVKPVRRDVYYGFKDDFLRSKTNIGTATIEHDFNKNLSLENRLRFSRNDSEVRVIDPGVNPTTGIVSRQGPKAVDRIDTIISNQTNLKTKFDTFGVKHDSISGIEVARETSENLRYQFTGVPNTVLNPTSYDYFSFTGQTTSADNKGGTNTAAVFVADTAHLTKWLDAIGSVRFDHIKSSFKAPIINLTGTQPSSGGINTGFSPTNSPISSISTINNLISWSAALNFKPTENGSIYVSAGTSFQTSAENFALNDGTANVDPEEARTYEIGTKWDFFNKKLSTSLAIFRTDKNNVREEFPANSGVFQLIGQQVVDGFEAQASGNITDQWKVFTGYAYLDGKVKKSGNSALVGATLQGTPRHTYNLFTTYRLPFDLEVGGGLNYVSERNASTSLTAPNTAPGYTTYNAMAKYYVNDKVDIQLNIENLTNKFYIEQASGRREVPGEGRVFMLTTTFSL